MNDNITKVTWKATKAIWERISFAMIWMGSIVLAIAVIILINTLIYYAIKTMATDTSYANNLLGSATVLGLMLAIVLSSSAILLGWAGCLLLGDYDRKDIHITYLRKSRLGGNVKKRMVQAEDVRMAAKILKGRLGDI